MVCASLKFFVVRRKKKKMKILFSQFFLWCKEDALTPTSNLVAKFWLFECSFFNTCKIFGVQEFNWHETTPWTCMLSTNEEKDDEEEELNAIC